MLINIHTYIQINNDYRHFDFLKLYSNRFLPKFHFKPVVVTQFSLLPKGMREHQLWLLTNISGIFITCLPDFKSQVKELLDISITYIDRIEKKNFPYFIHLSELNYDHDMLLTGIFGIYLSHLYNVLIKPIIWSNLPSVSIRTYTLFNWKNANLLEKYLRY